MYSKYFINISSFIISSMITVLIIICISKINGKVSNVETNKLKEINNIENSSIIQNSLIASTEELKEENNKEEDIKQNTLEVNMKTENKEEKWQLMIPKIDLIAPIKEGTEQSVINKTIGHFAETSIWDGNIGLASHNRGMRANFFENIKNLTRGDLIIYQKEEDIRQYEVSTIAIIQDNDWSYLQHTKDNRITLITCIRNQPNYRLCVQGVEI